MKVKIPYPLSLRQLQFFIKTNKIEMLDTVLQERTAVLAECTSLGQKLDLHPVVVEKAIKLRSTTIKPIFRLPYKMVAEIGEANLHSKLPPGELIAPESWPEKPYYFYPADQRYIECPF